MDAIADAYKRKFSIAWLSSAFTEESALPTFRTSSSASSLRLATSASASACSRRERSVGGVLPQSPSRAARAASTARSTSASEAIATFASASPVAGSVSSLTSPPEASVASPLMKSRYSRSVATATAPDDTGSVPPEGPNLDRPHLGQRMGRRDLDRLFEAAAFDDVESAERFLCRHERAIGDERLAVAHAD